MRQIFFLVLLFITTGLFAQAPANYTNINGRYRWIAGMFDSTFHIPKGTTPSLRTGGSTNSGGLFYNTSDSSVYTYTGTQWIKLRGSLNSNDTTNKYVTQVYKKSGSDSIFYVKGGIHTWAFNDSTGSPGGGGGGKVYYFNGGVSMGTFGGFTMYELGDTANTGAAANFTRSTTGNIANFITDSNKPGLLQIPAGVWTVDAWMSETGGGANHAQIWAVLEKWDGSTITTIATSPIEEITEGNTPNLYTWSITVPTTSLLVTDRIIIQFYITNTNGKTVTLYTQNGYVGEVHTTFTTGIGALNGLTAPAQYLTTGTSGTDFNISSVTATHTFNLPTASATNRGALSSADWTTFNNKVGGSGTSGQVAYFNGTNSITSNSNFIWDNTNKLGIGANLSNISAQGANVGVVTINGISNGYGVFEVNTQTDLDNQLAGAYGFTNSASATNYKLPAYIGAWMEGLTSTKRGANIRFLTQPDNAVSGGAIERLRISASGLLFIGNGETSNSPSVAIISGTGGSGANSAGAEFRIRGGASTGSAAGGAITFYTSASGASGSSANTATERARFTTDGRLGIATTTVGSSIQVNGNAAIGYSSSTTAPTNGLAVSGNTGIGTTSPNVSGQSAGVGVLTIQGSTNYGVVEVSQNSASADATLSGAYCFTNNLLSSGYKLHAYIGSWLQGGGVTSGGDLRFHTQLSGTAGANERMRIFGGGNVFIGSSPVDAGFRLDIGGTARTQQLHTFLQGTSLDATSTNYFHSVPTGGSTFGGLALRNQTQDYTGYIFTGRSGAANAINFTHTTFSGAVVGGGAFIAQRFMANTTEFGTSAQPHVLTIYTNTTGSSAITNNLILRANFNTNNTGHAIAFNHLSGDATTNVTAASIQSVKQNLTGAFITTSMRFLTINDGANTLTEKMRITDAGTFQTNASVTAASSLAQGASVINTLVAAANNDVLVGLDINPTFTNGAFTGVTNLGLRTFRGFQLYSGGASPNNHYLFSTSASSTDGTLQFRKTDGGGLTSFLLWNMGFRDNNTNGEQRWEVGGGQCFPTIWSNGGEAMRISAARNVSIGTTTDAGFRLDISGTARVQGQLSVGNTTTTGIIRAGGDVPLQFLAGQATDVFQFSQMNSGIFPTGGSTEQSLVRLTIGQNTSTNNNSIGSVIRMLGTLANTAATNVYNNIQTNTTINNTGGTTTYRGFYHNPTLTSLTGTTHRAIETVSGDVIFGSTSGNVMIGTTTAGGRFTIQPTNDQVGMAISGSSLTGSNAQSLVSLSQTWNTTGNPTAFLLNITNTASGATADLMELQVGGVSQFTVGKSGTIQTTAPAGGTAKPWKLGNVAVVSPTSPDRTIEVEIDGVTYYLHAKTTNN